MSLSDIWQKMIDALKGLIDDRRNIVSGSTSVVTAYTVNRVDLTNLFGALLIGVVVFFIVFALLKDRRRR